MVKRRDDKELSSQKSFVESLQYHRCACRKKWKRDDRKHKESLPFSESICHKSDNGKAERQRHTSGFGHIEARRRNVKPKKRENASDDRRTESRKIDLILEESDGPIRPEDDGKDTACKSVNAVNDSSRIDSE